MGFEEVVTAADDYCDVSLVDGRIILVTMSLSRLLEGLSDRFLRVHKSYAVNHAHVSALVARPGGGRQLLLAGGASIPVGRSYGDVIGALARPEKAALRPSPAGG